MVFLLYRSRGRKWHEMVRKADRQSNAAHTGSQLPLELEKI